MKAWLLVLALAACTDGGARPEVPPCDAGCLDEVGVRALREVMKLAFNLTLQGKPVGTHDVTVECPLGGSVRIRGTATSNAEQGSTFVELTYELDACKYTRRDDEPDETYALEVTGAIEQRGTLAVQPTSTTALRIRGTGVSVRGTVYDPPAPYEVTGCEVLLVQSGNMLSGSLCERVVAFEL